MIHLFVPYLESIKLKQLGFDEPCLALFDETYPDNVRFEIISQEIIRMNYNTPRYFYKPSNYPVVLTPTWGQAFDWFREKHNLVSYIEPCIHTSIATLFEYKIYSEDDYYVGDRLPYKEKQLRLLQKLIEIVKKKII